MSGQRRAPRRERRRSGGWREALLTTGAVLGVVCILMALGSAVFGLTPLVFRSGSMSPAIGTGALAVAKDVPAASISTGDIVSVTNQQGVRITHRVQSIDAVDDRAVLTLKGDANAAPDAETYAVTSVDRVIFSVPKLGYVISSLSGPVGIFAGGVFVAGLVFLAFGPQAAAPGSRRAVAVILVAGLGLGATNGIGTRSTLASFTDSAVMTTGTFATTTSVAPATLSCDTLSSGLLGVEKSARFTFPNSNPGYTHIIEAATTPNGAAAATLMMGPTTAATKTFTLSGTALLGGLTVSTVYVRVYSAFQVGGTTTWKTTAFRSWRLNVDLVLGYFSCDAQVA